MNGKRAFEVVIKDLELRSSWIILVTPKSNDKCPYKRQERCIEKEGKVM